MSIEDEMASTSAMSIDIETESNAVVGKNLI
jgi:hypothetical protein